MFRLDAPAILRKCRKTSSKLKLKEENITFFIMDAVLHYSCSSHPQEMSEDRFQIEVERREHYLFNCLQIQLRNVLTAAIIVHNIIQKSVTVNTK